MFYLTCLILDNLHEHMIFDGWEIHNKSDCPRDVFITYC